MPGLIQIHRPFGLPDPLVVSTVIGGTAAGSTLTLRSTNNGAPSGDYISFITGGSERIRLTSEGTLRFGSIDASTPGRRIVMKDSVSVGGTNQSYMQTDVTGNRGGSGSSNSGLVLNVYTTPTNVGSGFNAVASGIIVNQNIGISSAGVINTSTQGTNGAFAGHTIVQGCGDQNNERTVFYGGMRNQIGTGYTQNVGPAGSDFAVANFAYQGPIAVQPGVSDILVCEGNVYYNGTPSRGGQKTGQAWFVTGFTLGGEMDALHNAATTYPWDVGIGICGTSGSALPGATRGFTTAIQIGGVPGPWGGAGFITSSLIGTGINIRDYDVAGIDLNNAVGTGVAISVASTGGHVLIGGAGSPTNTLTVGAASQTSFRIQGYTNLTTHSAGISGQQQWLSGVGASMAIGVLGTGAGNHTSGTAPGYVGVRGVSTHGGTQNTTVQASLQAQLTHDGAGGTTTDAIGVHVQAFTKNAAATFTRASGIQIENHTEGTEIFAIRSLSTAKSLFTGNVQIGGTAVTTPAYSVAFGGAAARSVGVERHPTANTAGNNLTAQSGGATSGATDKASGALLLATGLGTGNAVPALVRLQGDTASATSGTTDHTTIDRQIANAFKVLTDNSAITVVNATIANNSSIGGVIDYTIEVTDGTDYQAETGSVLYAAANKAGVVTTTITEVNTQQNLTGGSTLASTWAASAANPTAISVNANSSLVPSTGYPRITFNIRNFGQQAIAIA